jgi:hypothetical protein
MPLQSDFLSASRRAFARRQRRRNIAATAHCALLLFAGFAFYGVGLGAAYIAIGAAMLLAPIVYRD